MSEIEIAFDKPVLYNTLVDRNSHVRDTQISFQEDIHKYTVVFEPAVKYTSVTTWIHQHFEPFNSDKIIKKMMTGKGWKEGHKYWGMTALEIKQLWETNKNAVSGSGTDLHYEIECFHNNNRLNFEYTCLELLQLYMYEKGCELNEKPIEWQYFINFVKDHPELKPFRTEWIVFNEDIKISGSIDMVYENPDGTLAIYDWKRAKNITRINTFNKFALPKSICHLPDSNFWHYTLQLNMYKYILETKYNKRVTDLYLVRLHPDAEEQNYELIMLPILTTEMEELVEERKLQLCLENT